MDKSQFDVMLSKYADVIVKVGLNLRNDQRLAIRAILEDAPLVRKVVESAYKTGARYVDFRWVDEVSSRLRLQYADPSTLGEIPEWTLKYYEEYYSRGDAELAISSYNPDLYNGIDPEKVAATRTAMLTKVSEPLRKYENLANWCVVASASPEWSKKVFPDLPVEEAQEKLWDAIFKVCRIDQPDPVAAWQEHIDNLLKYAGYMNAKKYTALHYKAPGTDLTIGLPANQKWSGAQETFKNGVTCTVNIPTEEIFTAAHKDKVNGVVAATRPLNISGALIEDFVVRFENGRAVNVSARKGEANLKKLLETDENAVRLGEAALVPHSSPVGRSGINFYNTLFDENAACHIAFGNAYRTSIIGGEDMTNEEFAKEGGNKSMIHVDFMIGSGEMDIDGIREDGSREAVLRNGEWAFKV